MFLKNLLVFNFSIKCFFKSLLLQTKKCNFVVSFFLGGGGGRGGKFTSQPGHHSRFATTTNFSKTLKFTFTETLNSLTTKTRKVQI